MDLHELFRLLSANPESLPWPERLALVEAIKSQQINTKSGLEVTANLLLLLAVDPKWEVRKSVADGLAKLNDNLVARIAAVLANDSNDYVKSAVDRAMARKRKVQYGDALKQDILLLHAEYVQKIEQEHGAAAVEMALKLAQDRCYMLAGSISHDLLNILTPVITAAEKIKDAQLVDIKENLEFLRQTIQDIEDMAKELPDGKHMEDVADLLTEAIEVAQKNISAVGFDANVVTVTVNGAVGKRFWVVRQLMISLLINLIKNAYESFMDRNNQLRPGNINVTVSDDPESIRITIVDNGMGISEDEIKRLTTYIPGRRNKAKKKSTGYGLPLAKKYIQKHGGNLFIHSQEDKGTEVTIVLPHCRELDCI